MRREPLTRRAVWAVVVITVLSSCAMEPPPRAAESSPAKSAAAVVSPLGGYLAARYAQAVHDYATAARLMEQALQRDPNNLDLIRRTFVLRVSEGRVAEAVPLARRIVALDGNTGLAGLVLLVEDIRTGNFPAATQRIGTLASDGPQRFALPLLDAWVEAGMGHPQQAQRVLQRMGDLRGLEPLRDLHLGFIADFEGRIDVAQAAYARVLAAEPEPTWRVVEVVGNFDERHGRTNAARQLYQSFAASDVDTDATAPGLARIAAGTVPPPLVATPRDGAAEALFDLASLLNQSETLDASLIYARLALALEPNFPLAQMLTAELREGEGRTEEALALYRAIDPHSSLAWSAQLRAAFALDTLGRTDEALASLRTMAKARPHRTEALVELGDILRSHSRFAEAAQAYDAAIARLGKIDKSNWVLFYDRGVALERSGDWSRAEADLKHALALDANQPMVLNYLGYSWIDKGENLTQALQMIQRAVELRPNDGYIVDSLGWAFYRLGDFERATHFLERAIELLPEDPTINDHLGDVYWRTGRLVEARSQWRRALQFGPEAREVKSIETKLDRGLAEPHQALRGG